MGRLHKYAGDEAQLVLVPIRTKLDEVTFYYDHVLFGIMDGVHTERMRIGPYWYIPRVNYRVYFLLTGIQLNRLQERRHMFISHAHS
jgi:hypothetical protein